MSQKEVTREQAGPLSQHAGLLVEREAWTQRCHMVSVHVKTGVRLPHTSSSSELGEGLGQILLQVLQRKASPEPP